MAGGSKEEIGGGGGGGTSGGAVDEPGGGDDARLEGFFSPRRCWRVFPSLPCARRPDEAAGGGSMAIHGHGGMGDGGRGKMA
jgi:hypothetical protein